MVWALRSFPLLRYAHGCLIPPCCCGCPGIGFLAWSCACCNPAIFESAPAILRSEEHTSELQSHSDLVCRLLLEKKKTTNHLNKLQIHNWLRCTIPFQDRTLKVNNRITLQKTLTLVFLN